MPLCCRCCCCRRRRRRHIPPPLPCASTRIAVPAGVRSSRRRRLPLPPLRLPWQPVPPAAAARGRRRVGPQAGGPGAHPRCLHDFIPGQRGGLRWQQLRRLSADSVGVGGHMERAGSVKWRGLGLQGAVSRGARGFRLQAGCRRHAARLGSPPHPFQPAVPPLNHVSVPAPAPSRACVQAAQHAARPGAAHQFSGGAGQPAQPGAHRRLLRGGFGAAGAGAGALGCTCRQGCGLLHGRSIWSGRGMGRVRLAVAAVATGVEGASTRGSPPGMRAIHACSRLGSCRSPARRPRICRRILACSSTCRCAWLTRPLAYNAASFPGVPTDRYLLRRGRRRVAARGAQRHRGAGAGAG